MYIFDDKDKNIHLLGIFVDKIAKLFFQRMYCEFRSQAPTLEDRYGSVLRYSQLWGETEINGSLRLTGQTVSFGYKGETLLKK